MANKAISFDDIIKADRQKKKQEELASQFLGKNRRSSAPGSGSGANRNGTKTAITKPGSLASRIGVTKRSASATVNPSKQQPSTNGRFREHSAKKDRINAERVLKAYESGNNHKTLSIKGASGPFVVIASNFAPGTTAADIQQALEPVTAPMLSCRITSSSPSVVAEFAYAEKRAAELTVANFHNQMADGRRLALRLKSAHSPSSRSNDDHFGALRAQADRERVRARRSQRQQRDLLESTQDDSYSGLYSDEMMVDAPAPNAQKKNNNPRRRRH